MNSPNRATLIAKLQKVLKKHYKPVVPPQRTLMEHLLYACCLENAPFEKADEAFAQLQQAYFDWNEVRVTSANELAEVFTTLPDKMAAAQRLKRVLQGIFDAIFTFDLEPLKKQNLGKSLKDLEKFGANPFALAYVTQNALGGHAIAADEGTFDVLVITGILSDVESAKGLLPGLERAIPKSKGPEFFSEVHQLAADYFAAPNSTRVKGILGEMVSDLKDRLAARGVQKKEIAVETAKAVAKEKQRLRQVEADMMNPPKTIPPGKPGAKEPAKDSKTPAKPEPAKPAAKESKDVKGKPPVKPAAKPVEKPAEKAKVVAKKPAPPPAPPPKKKPAPPPAKHEQKKKPVDSGKKLVSKGLVKKKPR